jgi:hypothetical protein
MKPPPAAAADPSPKTVVMWMLASLYIMAPASATALSPGSSSTSTNCISAPSILKSISSALPVRVMGGGAGAPTGPATNSSIWEMGSQSA